MKYQNKKVLLLGSIAIFIGVLVWYWISYASVIPSYFLQSYTDKYYHAIENLFNNSQYRMKNPTAVIPDEIVFSYASGAYMQGLDPIYINSEHTPLGKYLIGLGIYFFQNDKIIILISFIFTLYIVWLLSMKVLENIFFATLATGFFAVEKVFMNQLIYVPLLDIVQLPFILTAVLLYMYEEKKESLLWTSIFIGLVMATKSIVPGILLYGVFILHSLLYKQFHTIKRLVVFSPLVLLVFLLSYTKTFLDGYTILQFIGFQKWIFMYQKSKIEYPFSFWRFIYANQWQTWWGDKTFLKGEDWCLTWPIIVSLPFVQVIAAGMKKILLDSSTTLLLIYIFVFEAFLSLGVVSSRFFLPLFPVCYIVSVKFISQVILHICKSKN